MIKGSYEWNKSIDLQIMALKDAWCDYCKRVYITDMFEEGGNGMRKWAEEDKRAWFVDEWVRLSNLKKSMRCEE